jgi:hypothetical protein
MKNKAVPTTAKAPNEIPTIAPVPSPFFGISAFFVKSVVGGVNEASGVCVAKALVASFLASTSPILEIFFCDLKPCFSSLRSFLASFLSSLFSVLSALRSSLRFSSYSLRLSARS